MRIDASSQINARHCSFTSESEVVAAVLYEPLDRDRKCPAIVLSPPRLRTIDQLAWLARSLASRGYLVLAQRYRDGDTRYQLRDVDDVRNGITFLEGLPKTDPGRLGVIGHSRGGSASLRAAALDQRIRATVALGPPIDIARYVTALREYSPSRHRLMIAGYGATPAEDPEYYRQISPLTYAATLKNAVLLVHGTADLIAPHEHSEWMYEALIKAGNSRCRLELVSGMGHFFELAMEGYQFDRIADLVCDWFAENLRSA